MKSKQYRHKIFINTSISVKVGEGSRIVNFGKGTHYPRRNGMVKVTDEKLMEAIEKHPDYNKTFFLEKVNGKSIVDIVKDEGVDIKLRKTLKETEEKYNTLKDEYDTLMAENEILKIKLAKAEKEEAKNEPTPDTPVDDNNGDGAGDPTEPKVIVVKNIQEAKEILKGEPYNVSGRSLTSETATINRAKEHNIEFKFPKE